MRLLKPSTASVYALLVISLSLQSRAQPVVDMHLHYKWSQQDVTAPAQAIDMLRQYDVVAGVVIGTPAARAQQLRQLAPERLVTLWNPYREGGDWQRWMRDDAVVERAQTALATGAWQGIGELHLIGGFTPPPDQNRVLHALLALADEHAVPVMLHTEFARADYLLAICRQYPRVQIIWAHSGALLRPAQVKRVLDACANVHGGLAARDPWRFVGNPITGEDGVLLPEWRSLLLAYPDRFMVGSDPVWPVDRLDSWDEADTGWQELGRFWRFHRSWLAQLPERIAVQVGCINAARLFGLQDRIDCSAATNGR